MTWTTPRTWLSEVLTSSLLNTHLRDNLNALMVVTTKGDIAVATAATTLARLAVGSDGALLVADSAATPGVRWSNTAKVAATGVAIGLAPDVVPTAAANSDTLYSYYLHATIAKGAYTGLTAYGAYVPALTATGAGTIATAYGAYLEAQTIGTVNWSLYVAGGNSVLGGTSSKVFIGDTSNISMTAGLTINQGSNTDEAFALKSPYVDHGITDRAETDTYYRVGLYAATGGADVRSLGEDIIGWSLEADAVNGDTGKTTTAQANIILKAGKKSGTNITTHGVNENLVVITDYTTTRFIFDAEGSAHADVEWIAFDDYDDVEYLDSVHGHSLAHRDPLKAEFAKTLRYGRDELERSKIVHFDPLVPGHVMLNMTRMHMLEVGAIRQLAKRVAELEAWKNAHST